ncbi:MAG: hypothetical protein AAF391_14010, partial [Bacteroidota bacterium]
ENLAPVVRPLRKDDTGSVWRGILTGDGLEMIVGHVDGNLGKYEIDEKIYPPKFKRIEKLDAQIIILAASHSGKTIAALSSNNTLLFKTKAQHMYLSNSDFQDQKLTALLAYENPDSAILGFSNGRVAHLSSESGLVYLHGFRPPAGITSIGRLDNNQKLILGDADGNIHFLDHDGSDHVVRKAAYSKISHIEVLGDGLSAYAVSQEGDLFRIDVHQLKVSSNLLDTKPSPPIEGLTIVEDNGWLIMGGAGDFVVFDIEAKRVVRVARGIIGTQGIFGFSSEQQQLYVHSEDRGVGLIDFNRKAPTIPNGFVKLVDGDLIFYQEEKSSE